MLYEVITKNEWPTVEVDEMLRLKAVKPIERMLKISAQYKL